MTDNEMISEKNSKEFNAGGLTSQEWIFLKDTEHRDKNIINETMQGNFPVLENMKPSTMDENRSTPRHTTEILTAFSAKL